MLQAINDRIKGWLGIAVVALIGLPFGFWGIQSYLDDSGPKYAAKVNDTEISATEFERSVSMQRQSLLKQYGGSLPFEEKALRKNTMTRLVNQRLLESETLDSGYRISDQVVAAKIKQQFSVGGDFDRARAEATIASLGMSVPMFEYTLRNELRVDQMQNGITNSVFITRKELNDLAALTTQTRDITVLSFDVDHFSTAAKPTEAEIKQYYDANRQQFMVPEKVKVDYVEVKSEMLAENIKVDEAQIKKMYDDYVAAVSGREQRKASHILIQASDDKAAARAKIEALKKEIDNGADFAELAKKNSQDPGSAEEGGELGWVGMGEMAKPFEDSLFSLKLVDKDKGVVSDVVETQFGFHLIKLEDVRSEAVEPLSVKRHEFEDELKTEEAASMFYDLSERLASLAYENPDNLDVVVQELGLEVKSSDSFSRNKGDGLFADEKLRSAAFSPLVLEQGSNSDIIELSPTHVVVLRLNKHTPAVEIPLEAVSSKIEDILKKQNGKKETRAAALEIKSKIESGKAIDSFKSDGITLAKYDKLGRRDGAKVGMPSILHNAFDLQPGRDGKPAVRIVDLVDGGMVLVVLRAVNYPDEIPPQELEQVRENVARERANNEFGDTLSAIKNNADIDINARILDD
jgi:peptidyl-prolyl cis-trans isomerase D